MMRTRTNNFRRDRPEPTAGELCYTVDAMMADYARSWGQTLPELRASLESWPPADREKFEANVRKLVASNHAIARLYLRIAAMCLLIDAGEDEIANRQMQADIRHHLGYGPS